MKNDFLPKGVTLSSYKSRIKLNEKYMPESANSLTPDEKNAIIDSLLNTLVAEERLYDKQTIPEKPEDKRMLIRSLLNIRPPGAMRQSFINKLDMLLQHELKEKSLTDSSALLPVSKRFPGNRLKNPDLIFLWKGDITSLRVDAIVNAANDRMLGCFQPMHNCIDNVIHSAAGPLLREDCKIIMDMQGRREDTGDAKITRGYNLPARFVIHTVGPIIRGDEVAQYQKEELASCYISSLTLAAQIRDIKSIAFPCISTGVFNFPQGLAAETAVKTADEWLYNNPNTFTQIIFNVFLEEDFNLYERIFRG
ncbi:MAG: protein-ADP-ribose hydrolase [Desulfatiglans sp.]|jgi:O-acetyl-ADP-ribose deacetylase (regulator of RNase III)|nr:protein-ADP-ribose hydrolase [Desulfatiglans sp.]